MKAKRTIAEDAALRGEAAMKLSPSRQLECAAYRLGLKATTAKKNPKHRKRAKRLSTGKRRVSGLTIVKKRRKVTRAKRNPILHHSSHISQHFVNSIIRDFDMKRYSTDELIEIYKTHKGKGGAVRNGIAEAAKQLALNKGAKFVRK
jgi:hypothetical protein